MMEPTEKIDGVYFVSPKKRKGFKKFKVVLKNNILKCTSEPQGGEPLLLPLSIGKASTFFFPLLNSSSDDR